MKKSEKVMSGEMPKNELTLIVMSQKGLSRRTAQEYIQVCCFNLGVTLK